MELLSDQQIFKNIISSINDKNAIKKFERLSLCQIKGMVTYQKIFTKAVYFTTDIEKDVLCKPVSSEYGLLSDEEDDIDYINDYTGVTDYVKVPYNFIIYLKKIGVTVFTNQYVELQDGIIIFDVSKNLAEIHSLEESDLLKVMTRIAAINSNYISKGVLSFNSKSYLDIDTITRRVIQKLIDDELFE